MCDQEAATVVRARNKLMMVVRAEEIVKFRRVVGSDWLEYIYNV